MSVFTGTHDQHMMMLVQGQLNNNNSTTFNMTNAHWLQSKHKAYTFLKSSNCGPRPVEEHEEWRRDEGKTEEEIESEIFEEKTKGREE